MLAIKRESFRVEIRKQKLEQRFNSNRQIIKGDETINSILKSKSAKNTLNLNEEQTQLLKNSLLVCSQQIDCDTIMILKQLNKMINGVNIEIKLYLLELDILNILIQLKLNDDETNIILIYGMTLIKQLIDDQYIIRQIMQQKKLRDQLVQYFSYLTNHIQDTNRETYWRLMEVFQQNTMHYYSIQRNILQINLEEIVINQDEQLETFQLQLITVILTVFKNKIETEFQLLFHYKKYDSTPYQALLEILRNENTSYEICQIVIRILILLIQNIKIDKLLFQIINPSLFMIIQNMLYRNEEIQLIALRLIQTIIKTELFITIEHKIELLRKLYMFASVKVKLEILKLFYEILSKNRLHLLADKLIEQNITQLLYDSLHQDLYNEIVILSLKCLYHTFHKLPTHQLRQILYDQTQIHDQLSKLVDNQNEMISKLAELILDTFIINI